MNWSKSKHWAFPYEVAAAVSAISMCFVSLRSAESSPAPGSQEEAELKDSGASGGWGSRLRVQSSDRGAKAEKDPAESKPGKNGLAHNAGGERGVEAPLAIPLVQGYDSFGLNLPDHDLQGRLRSLFVIGAISRVDDRNVEIRESFLETYAEDGSPEFSIELPKATLDRFTRVLVSKTPVTLRKAEFELKGASLEFNTTTKEGGLGGPVQMTIYAQDVSVSRPPKKGEIQSATKRPAVGPK